MESQDAEFSEHGRTPIPGETEESKKLAALKLWHNSAYGKHAAKHGGIPHPTQPRSEAPWEGRPPYNLESDAPPRGEATPPRKKDSGHDGYTDMNLMDIAEMCAVHHGHMGRGQYTDCACMELLERATLVLLLTAQHEAEKNGMDGGRNFRYLIQKCAEEL